MGYFFLSLGNCSLIFAVGSNALRGPPSLVTTAIGTHDLLALRLLVGTEESTNLGVLGEQPEFGIESSLSQRYGRRNARPRSPDVRV